MRLEKCPQMLFDFNSFSGKENLSKKKINQEMFGNIMPLCYGQEWTSAFQLLTNHMTTFLNSFLSLSSFGRMGLQPWIKLMWSNWEGAVREQGMLCGCRLLSSRAAFKLKFWSLILTWAMLQASRFLPLYLDYLGLDPDLNIWLTLLSSGPVSLFFICLGTTGPLASCDHHPQAISFPYECHGVVPLVIAVPVTLPFQHSTLAWQPMFAAPRDCDIMFALFYCVFQNNKFK